MRVKRETKRHCWLPPLVLVTVITQAQQEKGRSHTGAVPEGPLLGTGRRVFPPGPVALRPEVQTLRQQEDLQWRGRLPRSDLVGRVHRCLLSPACVLSTGPSGVSRGLATAPKSTQQPWASRGTLLRSPGRTCYCYTHIFK